MAYLRVFKDGFEDYALNEQIPTTHYSVSQTNSQNGGFGTDVPKCVDRNDSDTHGPRTGAKMLRLNYEGDNDSSYSYTDLVFAIPDTWNEIFIRFYANWDTNFSQTNNAHLFRFFDGADHYCYIQSSEQEFGVAGEPQWWGSGSNPQIDAEFSPFAARGTWFKLQFYFKFNSPNHYTMTLNDILADNSGGEDTDNTGFSWSVKFTTFNFLSNWSSANFPPDALNCIYIDDFEVFADQAWGLGWDEATTGTMAAGDIQVAEGGGSPTRRGSMSLR